MTHSHDIHGMMAAIETVSCATGIDRERIGVVVEQDSEKAEPSAYFTVRVRQVATKSRKNSPRIDIFGYGESIDEAVTGAIAGVRRYEEAGGGW